MPSNLQKETPDYEVCLLVPLEDKVNDCDVGVPVIGRVVQIVGVFLEHLVIYRYNPSRRNLLEASSLSKVDFRTLLDTPLRPTNSTVNTIGLPHMKMTVGSHPPFYRTSSSMIASALSSRSLWVFPQSHPGDSDFFLMTSSRYFSRSASRPTRYFF